MLALQSAADADGNGLVVRGGGGESANQDLADYGYVLNSYVIWTKTISTHDGSVAGRFIFYLHIYEQ